MAQEEAADDVAPIAGDDGVDVVDDDEADLDDVDDGADAEAEEDVDDVDEADDDDDDDVADNSAEVVRRLVAERARNGKTTHKTYLNRQKAWARYWRDRGRSPAVTKNKTGQYIEDLTKQRVQRVRRGGVEGQLLGYKALQGAMSAIVDLWSQQEYDQVTFKGRTYLRGEEHPRSKAVKALLRSVRWRECQEAQRLGISSDGDVTNLANGFDDINHFRNVCKSLLTDDKHVSLRTRLQCLLSHASLGRGDDIRSLRLWNMYMWRAPCVGPTSCDMLLCGMPGFHSRKTQGAAPYLAIMRHRDPHLCGVGATALYLWYRFGSGIARQKVPDFTQRLSWCGYLLFENTQAHDNAGLSTPVSAQAARNQLKAVFDRFEVKSTKVEHIFRLWSQQHATTAGGGRLSADALNQNGSWGSRMGVRETTYCPTPAIQACLVLGGHNKGVNWDEDFYVRRATYESPLEEQLAAQVFPWAAEWLDAVREGTAAMTDGTSLEGNSRKFCELLLWLARVLIQDAPFLQPDCPSAQIWTQAPFSTPEFKEYAAGMVAFFATPPVPESAASFPPSFPTPTRARAAISRVQPSPDRDALLHIFEQNQVLVEHTRQISECLRTGGGVGGSSTASLVASSTASLVASSAGPSTAAAARAADAPAATGAAAARPRLESGPFSLNTNLRTVSEVWAEYSTGLPGSGQPPIRDIIQLHGSAKWQWVGRSKHSTADLTQVRSIQHMKSRRKVFWDEILRDVDGETTEEVAAQRLQRRFEEHLEETRGCKKKNSLDTFFKLIRGEQIARGVRPAKRQRGDSSSDSARAESP